MLRLIQGDLELGAAARRLLLQQLGHGHAERGGKLLDKRQPRLALAVLDEREHQNGVRPTFFAPRSARVSPLNNPPRVLRRWPNMASV